MARPWLDPEKHAFWDSKNKWVHREYSGEKTAAKAKSHIKRLRKKHGRGIFVARKKGPGRYGIYMKKYTSTKSEIRKRFPGVLRR